MFRRSLRARIGFLLVAPILTGCLVPEPAALSDADGDAAGSVVIPPVILRRDSFAFEGTFPSSGIVRHALAVPADALQILARVETSSPVGEVDLGLFAPDGTRLARSLTGSLSLNRAGFEEFGPGEYTLRVQVRPLPSVVLSIPWVHAPYALSGEVAVGTPGSATLRPAASAPAGAPGVVVAVVDGGINPYHVAFGDRGAPLPAVVDAVTGEPPLLVPRSHRPDYAEALLADDAAWGALERGRLYQFEGTRVWGIHLGGAGPGGYRVLDTEDHGTGVAGILLREAPGVSIVMVQPAALQVEDIAAAFEWVAAQPWIDMVSASIGGSFNLPPIPGFYDSIAPFTREIARSGKPVFLPAGNEPTVSWTDPFSGPPWVISVSGVNPEEGSRVLYASNFPDFVAEYYVTVPTRDSVDEERATAGTSFSTPAAAGRFARALLEVRQATGHLGSISDGRLVAAAGLEITAHDLVEAFARSSTYWGPDAYRSEWDLPVAPAAPWLQMGWGYPAPDSVATAVAHLLGEEAPAKPPEAVAWMEGRQRARSAMWGEP